LLGGGQYVHFGIETGIVDFCAYDEIDDLKSDVSSLDLQLNVDGVPLYNSASASLWPILCLPFGLYALGMY
jgi:hypothetical protein